MTSNINVTLRRPSQSTNNIDVSLTPSPANIFINQGQTTLKYLDDLLDVNTTGKQEGSLLTYDAASGIFITSLTSSTIFDNRDINGGQF